ncbi:olfactory receptor 4D5-like [Trichosurus vulpecula]|uniref:olfactory receptor 4D5-like n=1 Tax=Trichosurus vulpecula TaxID=9337 RepID=UPI00186B5625|nr:olfactory receptor 4D5-like [Trichosurus vulpecula]
MNQTNATEVTEFVLLGLSSSSQLQPVLFFLFLVLYLLTILGNGLIIITVTSDHHLPSAPMYFLLCNLSFQDLCYSTVTVPKMLSHLVTHHKTISFQGCIAQIFFFHFTGSTEIFILAIMVYDRYIAICRPLNYELIMSQRTCWVLAASSVLGGVIHSITPVVLILCLPFCSPNELDNFYCDIPQIIKLACTNTFVVGLLMVSNSSLVTLLCFLVLLIFYTILLVKIRNHLSEGKSKALSTCASHLMVVTLVFVPCVYIYARPFQTFPADRLVSILYTIITPMLNPLIYTLMNAEMKNAMRRMWNYSS